MIEWNASPELIRIGFLSVRWYSLCFAAAFFFMFFIMRRMFRSEGVPEGYLDDLFLYMFLGVIIGARLGHVLFYDPGFYFEHPMEIFKVWKGGLASHGAAFGTILALVIYVRRHPELTFGWTLDRLAVCAPLGAAFVRIGNLFNSEIYGKPAGVPWAFVYNKIDLIPRHPTQLYEALAYLILFAVMIFAYRSRRIREEGGFLLGIMMTGLFASRFVIEFFKEVQVAFEKGLIINMGQILSIPFMLFGIYLLVRSIKNTRGEQKG